jgi:sugar phosphate isomerase/epimerase
MIALTRRRFLSLTTAATVASTIGSRFAFAFPMGLPPGIQLYAVREPLAADAPGTLKAVHDIGFREVESAGFGKYSATEFSKLISDAGLKCPSAHLPFKMDGDLGPVFADANALGAHYATSSIMPAIFNTEGPTPDPDRFKKTAARMNEIGRAAKAAGLQYAYHNHNPEFDRVADGSYGYNTLLRETDHDLVKFEIDCGWMSVAGVKPQDFFAKYPGRFRMLHVKDFKPRTPTTDVRGANRPVGVELGHGFIDYKPIFAAGRAAGIEHAFAEQEAPYVRSQLDSAKVSYDYFASFS